MSDRFIDVVGELEGMTRRTATVVLVLVVVLAVVPGVAAAASRAGGTVVVDADETIDDDLQAFGGTIAVRGTVDGDLQAFGGTVVVTGTVTGDVEAAGGTVQVLGDVGGDVDATGGTVDLGEGAVVNGTLSAAAGSVRVAGTVGEDARLAGDVRLTESAVVSGDLRYDGDLDRAEGATVEGSIERDQSLDVGPVGDVSVPQGAFTLYGVVVTFLLGAFLLVAFPAFSGRVAADVATDPLWTAGIGLAATVAIPVVLVLVALTIVGIPLTLAGLLAFALLAWVGAVYGRYALGAWLLSLTDYESRWLALVLGVVLVAVLRLVPVVDPLVRLVVFLLGFGALVRGLWQVYRARRGAGAKRMIDDTDARGAPSDAEPGP